MNKKDREDTPPDEVEFAFEHDSGYRIIAANGVWGELTPRGDVRVDFFVEELETPQSVVNKIEKEDGNSVLGREISRVPEKRRFSRKLQVGLLLSVAHAEDVGKWLIGKAEEFRKKSGSPK